MNIIRRQKSISTVATNIEEASSLLGAKISLSKPSKINSNNKMEKKTVQLIGDYRYQSILSSRSVPILFIIICFLIIANTRCDQVGSTNAEESTTSVEQEKTTTKTTTYDPLNMLREIYLDHNSKVITMILPSNGDQVQKFHPNGRYGRRSVNNFVESHAELGKLRINDDSGSLRSILRSYEPITTESATSNPPTIGRSLAAKLMNNNNRINNNNNNNNVDEKTTSTSTVTDNDNDFLINNQMELSKLLKCNFTGISNLYWCSNGIN